MKTRTLTFPRISPGMLSAIVAAAVIAVSVATLIARADTAPTITNSIQSGTNVALTTAPIGTSVFDVATIASSTASTTPTGTVDFSVYANTSCSGTPTTQSAVALVDGAATSSNSIVPAAGLSYRVHYSGDANNSAVDSSCQALTATSASVSLSTALSTSTVLAGSTVYDTATLSGETADATGTVAYTAYSNNLCTTGATSAGVKTVASGVSPDSDALLFNFPGTYYWQAVYSGDQHNSAATSTCASEPLAVQATSTPVTPPATTTPGTINGNVFNDSNCNDIKDAGESGLSGWTIWLHMGTLSDGYNNPIVKTTMTDGNGTYSFSSLALGTYFVEEQEPAGWTQTSSDTKVTLTDASQGATVDFANMMKNGTTTGGGHGKGIKRCDGDNDADDTGCTATTTPLHIKTNGDGFFNGILGHFNFSFKSNGHDNGKHLGQIKNGNNGKNGGDNDNDTDD